MTSFTESADDDAPPMRSLAWCLTLVHHADPSFVGRRTYVPVGTEQDLGRDAEAFGPGALSGKGVSRAHARLSVDAEDELFLQDLRSKNGTFVNGQRVSEQVLVTGDVVGIGSQLFVVGRAPAGMTAERSEHGPVAYSPAMIAARRAACALGTSRGPVVVLGEHGTGKDVMARYLHDLGGGGPMVKMHPGACPDEEAPVLLFGRDAKGGLLAEAAGGTLLLTALELAGPKLQGALLHVLDATEQRADAPRILFTTTTPLETLKAQGFLRPLVGRLAHSMVEIPPLRERREDVPMLFRKALEECGAGRDLLLDARLVLGLLRHAWPDNVRELFALARHVAARADAPSPELTAEILEILGTPWDATPAPQEGSSAIEIAASGAWLRERNGKRVDFGHRPNLSRVLGELAKHRREGGGAPLSPAALFHAGWPGERVARASANARVYVAIGTLRKLGLRSCLESDGAGYRLSPDVQIVEERSGEQTS